MATRKIGMLYLFLLAIIGAIFGNIYIQLLPHATISDLLEKWGPLFNINKLIEGSATTLWISYAYHLHYLIMMLILGLTIVGYPIAIILHFIKSFLIGASIQLFITLWDDEAIKYVFIWIVPSSIFVILASVFMCSALGSYSLSFLSLIKSKNWRFPLVSLIKPLLLCCLLLFLAALLHTYLSPYLFYSDLFLR